MRHAEEYALYSAQRDTRSFFRAMKPTRKAAEYWNTVAVEGIEAFSHGRDGGHSSGIGDPTANRAAMIVDYGDKVVEHAREKLAECTTYLGAGLVVVESVRAGLGSKYADALDLHYMDGLDMHEAAEQMHVNKSTAARWISTACDWCDWRGPLLFM